MTVAAAPTVVRDHYERGSPAADALAEAERILATLDGPPTAQALAGLDQFHLGGLAATRRLAELAEITAGATVLDAGSGLGGPSRHLAEACGCRVTGLDLTPAFVAVARLLAERTGLSDRVSYRVGDVTALPFPDAGFDFVWTQHVVMNVEDRLALYTGFARVLRPGGRFAFHDVVAMSGGALPVYPTPWATTPGTSHLLTADDTGAALTRAGLRIVRLVDVTDATVAAMAGAPPPGAGSGLARIMGPRFSEMAGNLARNLREGRLGVVMGIAETVA